MMLMKAKVGWDEGPPKLQGPKLLFIKSVGENGPENFWYPASRTNLVSVSTVAESRIFFMLRLLNGM